MRLRRDLGWLAGMPLPAGWHVVELGGPARIEHITGRSLQNAIACVRWAQREHAPELRRLVGDAEAWGFRHLTLIDAVKPLIDGFELTRRPLLQPNIWPSALSKRLRGALEGPLSDLVCALAWSGWTEPSGLARALTWCDENRAALVPWLTIDGAAWLATMVRYVRMASVERADRTAALTAWLGDSRTTGRPLRHRPSTDGIAPPAEMRSELLAIVETMAAADAKTRRRSFDVFGLLAPPSLLRDWAEWWPRYERAKTRLDVLLQIEKTPAGTGIGLKAERVRRRVKRLTEKAPPPITATSLKSMVTRLAASDGLFEAIRDAMADWPLHWKRGNPSFALAAYWSRMAQIYPQKRGALEVLIRGIGRYVRERGEDGLRPWRAILRADFAPYRPAGVDYELLSPSRTTAQIETFFEALRASPEPFEDAGHVATLAFWLPRARVSSALAELRKSALWDRHITAMEVHTAHQLSDDAPARFVQLLGIFADVGYDDMLVIQKRILPRLGALQTRDLVLNGHVASLAAIGKRLAFASDLDIGPPPPPHGSGPGPWLARYPIELRDALAYVSHLDPHAETTATKVIGRAIVGVDAVAHELANLRAMLAPNEAQRRRIDKLEHWQPEPLSPARAANISQKIRDAGRRRFTELWQSAVDDVMVRALTRLVGEAVPPAWIREPGIIRLLLGLSKLPKSYRTLATTLLAKRLGPAPWDLRDHPRNQAFVARMHKLGIVMEPWLDACPRKKTSAVLSLTLEADPLEVLQMGAHFDTCLSPYGVNYFSAVVNAVDVNKRVIYVRNAQGGVVGRCLVALTDEGQLTAFQTYAHDMTLDLHLDIRAYVRDLARVMNTSVTANGTITPLLGADLSTTTAPSTSPSATPPLADNSPLRAELPRLGPHEAAERIARALEDTGLNDTTLPYVLDLPGGHPQSRNRGAPGALDHRREPARRHALAPMPHAARRPRASSREALVVHFSGSHPSLEPSSRLRRPGAHARAPVCRPSPGARHHARHPPWPLPR